MIALCDIKVWFQHHWKKLSLVGAVFMTVLALLDSSTLQGMYKKMFAPPKLELSYDSDGEVNPGDRVILKYSVPTSGFMSVWNQSATGETKRLLPLQGMSALMINERISRSSFEIKALQQVGQDKIILLWTPSGVSEHLPRNAYRSAKSFAAAYSAFEQSIPDLQKKEITISVFPTR